MTIEEMKEYSRDLPEDSQASDESINVTDS